MTDQMTNAALRREIAELQGYRAELHSGWWFIRAPGGWMHGWMDAGVRTAEGAWEYSDYPDWPDDPGVAHLLCWEIALANNWSVMTTPYSNGTIVAEFVHAKTEEHIADDIGDTGAQALSRLAHAALKAQAVPHG